MGEPTFSEDDMFLLDDAREDSDRPAPVDTDWKGGTIQPLDVFGNIDEIGTPPCPISLVPPVIAERAFDVAKRLGVDVDMLIMPMITAVAACIDDRVKIQPLQHDTSWREEARLWTAIVAEAGEKKTAALMSAVRPIMEVEEEWTDKDLRDRAAVEDENLALAAAKKKAIQTRAIALARGETPKEIPLPTPKPLPVLRRKLVSDTTIEALTDMMKENTWGLFSVQDELSSWFASFDYYRSNVTCSRDRAKYLETFNGGRNIVDRQSKGRVFVKNWSLSLCGGIQPGPMKRLAGQIVDDGLVQRFLVVFCKVGEASQDVPENEEAKVAYHNLIKRLLSWNIGGKDAVRLFTLTPEAQAVRTAFTVQIHALKIMPQMPTAFRSHLSKWEGLYPRLLLTWHVMQHGDHLHTIPDQIDVATAACVSQFMMEYLLPHSSRFYATILSKDYSNDIGWIAGYILSRNLSRITARDIERAYPRLRGERALVVQTMEYLEALGWVEPWEEDRARVTRWRVNPLVHQLFAPRAIEEKARRAAAREQVKESIEFMKKLKLFTPTTQH